MIAHLRGVLMFKAVERIVVDVQGVGYQAFIPLSTYYTLPNLHESVTLLTTLHVREDIMRLYGFATEAERLLFDLLVGVSSIGPRLALNMLSSLAVADLQRAMAQGDVARLQTIPGIGRKTAERVVLELQEKAALVVLPSAETTLAPGVSATEQLVGDVVSALLHLGYKQGEAERAIRNVRTAGNGTSTLETLLKDALQQLTR